MSIIEITVARTECSNAKNPLPTQNHMPPTVLALLALVLGAALGYYLRYQHALSQKRSIEVTIKERVVEAEEKALRIIEKAEAKAETFEK